MHPFAPFLFEIFTEIIHPKKRYMGAKLLISLFLRGNKNIFYLMIEKRAV